MKSFCLSRLNFIIFCICLSLFMPDSSILQADDYISTDDFLEDDTDSESQDSVFIDNSGEVDNYQSNLNTHSGIFTITVSDSIRKQCVIPDNFVPQVVSSLKNSLINSGKFKIVTLDHSTQNELQNELKRVVELEIMDSNSASIDGISGIRYIAVLTFKSFAVKKRNFNGSKKYKNGAMEFKAGLVVQFINTSTRIIDFQTDVSARQLAPLSEKYNYIDNGTSVDYTLNNKVAGGSEQWGWSGNDEYNSTDPGAFAESSFKYTEKDSDYDEVDYDKKDVHKLNPNQKNVARDYSGSRGMDNIRQKFKGESKIATSGEYQEDAMHKEFFKLSQQNFASEALSKLATKLSNKSVQMLSMNIYPKKVIKVLANNLLAINSGSENGISTGQTYNLTSVVKEKDPDTGKILSFFIPVGIVQILSVEDNTSIAELTQGDISNIKIGMILTEHNSKKDNIFKTNSSPKTDNKLPFKRKARSSKSSSKW